MQTRKHGTPNMVDIDEEELEFLIHQVWKNRCATTGLRIGGHASLVLSRWDEHLPPTVSNLVLTTQAEAAKLEKVGHEAFSSDIRDYVLSRLLWARNVCEDDMFGNIRSLTKTGDIVQNSQRKILPDKNSTAANCFGASCANPLMWCAFGAFGAYCFSALSSKTITT